MNYPCNCLFKFLFAIKHKRFKHYNNRNFFLMELISICFM